MNREKLSLNKIFYNNRFLLITSIILAVIIWLIVALQFSPEDTRVIKNVPVKIDMSNNVKNFDLQIFGTKEFFVDVTVMGKRYVVSGIKTNDLLVTAKTNYVDSTGKYILQLDVKSKTQNPDYEITGVSNDTIEVFFDIYKESEYSIIPQIVSEKPVVPEGYFQDKEVLSASKVSISGPATEVNKIKQVIASVKLTKTLTTTKTFITEIIPTGEYGGTLRYLTINDGNVDITMTIPVYKLAELPVTAAYRNVPLYYLSNPLKLTCSPQRAIFAVPEESLKTMESVSLATIDFNNIKAGMNTFTIKSGDIAGAIVRDGTKAFTIKVDAGNMSEKVLSVNKSNISVINAAEGYNTNLVGDGIARVIAVGPQPVIRTLTQNDVFAVIDLSGVDLTKGTIKVPAKVYIKGQDKCWIRGNYPVNLSATAK